MDKRVVLRPNACIHLAGLECIVEREIGRGSNAVVYKAKYPDAADPRLYHHILLKELFPYHEDGKIYRAGDGVTVISEDDAYFLMHRNSFLSGNQVHLKLREQYPGMFGNNINTCTANATYYTILDFSGGRTLKVELEEAERTMSLRGIVKRMIGISDSLAVFHDMGLLHLDVSPDNILLTNTGSNERIELIDYNSVIPVSPTENVHLSSKPGFASPEVRTGNISSIGYWTDLYSVAAVFFYVLQGRTLSRLEQSGIQKVSVSGCPYLQSAPQTVSSLISHILKKGLNPVPRCRYQTVAEFKEDLCELLDRIDGVGITHSALWETGKQKIDRQIKANPSLKYLTESAPLYPIHIEAPQGHTIEDFLHGCANVVLFGSGGIGKTTLLMDTVLRHTRQYRKDCPAMIYLSLYDYCEGDANFIHDSLLKGMKFKRETENYGNARHALDVLLQKPIKTKNGECPVLCLFLDGYNEAAGDTQHLRNEIERLAVMDGVSILVTSRSELPELSFEAWRLEKLTAAEVQEILGRNGMLMPKTEEMTDILTNALMLTLYIRACSDSGEQFTIETREHLIHAYLDALLKKELDALPENSPLRWQIEAGFRCVYPVLASMEQSGKQHINSAELLRQVTDLYAAFRSRAFLKKYPGWIGHTSDIYGACKNADDWYGAVIHDLLWRRLGLLMQCDEGAYRLQHQDFLAALAPEGRQIQKAVQNVKNRKRLWLSLAAMPILFGFVAVIAHIPQPQAEPYDALKAVDALGEVQIVYSELNRQMKAVNGLLSDETPEGRESDLQENDRFEKARNNLQGLASYILVDRAQDKQVADDYIDRMKKKLNTGERFPWNQLSFDWNTYLSMTSMLDENRETYGGYIDILEYIHINGSPEDYGHCGQLIRNVLLSEAKLVALYNYAAYTLRMGGLAAFENTPEGREIWGAFERLSAGSKEDMPAGALTDDAWTQLDMNGILQLIANTENKDVTAAKQALATDMIYQNYKMLLIGQQANPL